MNCSKCSGTMVAVRYQRIQARRCRDCGALWCPAQSLERMKNTWMSEYLDSGDPQVGRQFDVVRGVDCPGCGSPMLSAPDPDQTHIIFESCDTCGGVLFDAGEFTDWKYDTLMDRFRDLFNRN